MRLSLGPILYYWPRERVFDFYEEAARWPVDVIYLGETVCAKRRELRLNDWLLLAQRLAAAGKEVVLSSLTLVAAASERMALRRLCENDAVRVEANDLGAVELLSRQGVPFVGGAALNVYNHRSLRCLQEAGLYRWVAPVELCGDSVRGIREQAVAEHDAPLPETEVFAYGHLPLAYSARCFTARYHDRAKDDCEFVCLSHPDGLLMESQEGAPVFRLNGIQTQSAAVCNLLDAWQEMERVGVDLVRISPQWQGTAEVVEAFAARRSGEDAALEGDEPYCNGYWYDQPGMLLTGSGTPASPA